MESKLWEFVTRTGARLFVRQAGPDDDPVLNALFHHVLKEDLRFRFLSSLKEVGAEQLRNMTHIDHRTVETYIAFIDGNGAAVATAMLAVDAAGQRGEVAISVRAEERNRGIGWSLLSFVAEQAKARGLKFIESIESRANHDAIEIEQDLGFTVKPYPDDNTLVLVTKSL